MKLRTSIAIVGIALCGSSTLHAQKVGIRTNDPKAIVEVSSTISGVLMPRMDSIRRVGLNVGADQNGMQVYDTDSKSFWYYDHSIPKWLEIKYISNKFVDGVPASTAVYTTGNVGIGTDSPTENVHVVGNMFSEDTLAGQKLVIGPHSNVLATGGTITTAGHYTVHTFTSSGTFVPNGNTDIEYLVVGGGGGGGQQYSGEQRGGGGGAGGFLEGTTTLSNTPYAITVGNGGFSNGNGANSSIGTAIVAIGGGAGGATNSGDAQADGRAGGSGGGAAAWHGSFNGGANAYHGAVGGAGTAGQGNNGGSSAPLDVGVPAAGGGGAGGPGQFSSGRYSGSGGIGRSSDITGTTQWYAGGGGSTPDLGSTVTNQTRHPGGLGGGGDGLENGTPNTGGGGGGGGASGGSGIVIIRYLAGSVLETKDTYVGVGTPNPTASLSVSGDANKPGGGSWAVFSDERSKENITEYTKGAEELLELQPVSFQYKEAMNWGTDTHVGLIAQEVEKAVPSMVTTKKVNNINDFKEVDPNELNYMLINAVKELQEKQTALKQALTGTSQQIDKQLEQLKVQAIDLCELKIKLNTALAVANKK